MSTINITDEQISSIKGFLKQKKSDLESSVDYNLEYAKIMFQPETPNFIILKLRIYGISGGMPFDDITYTFFNLKGEKIAYKNEFRTIPAWFEYVAGMREINITNGKPNFVN